MNKKGFTLVEILSVIIVVAALSLLIIPGVVNMISSRSEDIVKANEKLIFSAAKLYMSDNQLSGNQCIKVQELVDKEYLNGPVKYEKNDKNNMEYLTDREDGKEYVVYVSNNKYAIYNNCPYTDQVLNGADPVLKETMIPIYFDGNTAKKADISKEWYNYTNKQWANAIVV